MPLEDPQVIDAIRKTEDGKIVLGINDAGTISDPKERTARLVQKLKIYINSIVSGDLKKEYPERTARDFIIEVVCSRRPAPEMLSISQVMPRKDPANTVPVRFVESAEGAWGPSHPELFGGVKSSGPGSLDPLLIAALERGVELAEPYLAEGEKGFYFAVLGWENNKTDAVFFRENSVTEEVKKEVDKYVRELSEAFTVCVVVSLEKLKYYIRSNHEAVILVVHRRGWREARVYARKVRWHGGFLHYEPGSRLELVGAVSALFPN